MIEDSLCFMCKHLQIINLINAVGEKGTAYICPFLGREVHEVEVLDCNYYEYYEDFKGRIRACSRL